MQSNDTFENEYKKRREQWTSFVDYGLIVEDVNPMIAQSWIRSKSMSIDPYKPAAEHLSDRELDERMRENHDMMRFAKPLMDKMLELTKETANIMSLHDRDGYMLTIAYHDTPKQGWREQIFRPGVKWSEDQVGTNGVGLALIEDSPVQVWGAEHYCYLQRDIACSATTIHGINGEVIGVLNVSGPYLSTENNLLALVSYGAYFIESQMALNRSYELMNTTLNAISEGLIIFDTQYKIVHSSKYLQKMFRSEKKDILGINVKKALDIPYFEDYLQQNSGPFTIQEQVCSIGKYGIPCNVRVTPLMIHGEFSGGVLLLRESKSINKLTNTYSGNYSRYTFEDIITADPSILAIIENMKRAAETDCNVLIEGESGTGKELFAHAIHSCSKRRNEPFIAINCASLPRSLVESELFGYEKGSFSGALSNGNPGKFELANGGSIFLDEIGELPFEIQAKLLRVLDTHRVSRIGSKTEKELDIRIIAATNRTLYHEIQNHNFREDLYYRLNVFTFNIPPLRERMEDIPLLARTFIEQQNSKGECAPKTASAEFIEMLCTHSWPGNVRELQNVVIRAYFNCITTTIGAADAGRLFIQRMSPTPANAVVSPSRALPQSASPEAESIRDMLASCGGNVELAAEKLGVSRATLYRKLKRYGINPKHI